jgi:CRP/FNR family transcriptional regulator
VLLNVAPDSRSRFLRGAVECRFTAGEFVRAHDEPGQSGFVLDGLLRSFLLGPGGREQIVTYHRAGDLFGAGELLGGATLCAIQCVMSTRLVRVAPHAARTAVQTDPVLANAVGTQLARDHHAALVELALTAFGTVRHRVARQLLLRADPQGAVIDLTHREIAQAVGSVREVVGRSMQELEAAGAVRRTTEGQLVIDRDAMAAEATLAH